MTKLLIISDTHTEFHKDRGVEFIQSLDNTVDTVVIAGDLSDGRHLGSSLNILCKHFNSSSVVYIPGNHEYYYKTREDIGDELFSQALVHSNLFILNKVGAFTVPGWKGKHLFIGCTLWFRDNPKNTFFEYMLNDFNLIKDYKEWVYEENRLSINFLANNITKDSIVVTHHLPCFKSVPHKYKNSTLKRFFLCDLTELILDVQPKLWVHGHTHSHCDYKVGNTRIICNPLGYPTENTRYIHNMIVEI